jgi:signal transduction histidine kinase
MLSEVLIFVPSVARYRLSYLEDRVSDAHLAMFALESAPDRMVSQRVAEQLLANVGARGIIVHRPNNTVLVVDSEVAPRVDATYDLRSAGMVELIADAMMALVESGNRVLRVVATAPRDPRLVIEVLLDERAMRLEIWSFGLRVLELSIVISLLTAALVYISLQWLLVTPLRRLTASMIAFRDNPEDESRVIVPGQREDEVGLAERELAAMQQTVRHALRQRERLAALGTAVIKINHDLRNILSTARLMSDGLADCEVPEVQRVTPRLLAAIDRAVALCTGTLKYTREGAPPLRRTRFALSGLVEELAELVEKSGEDAPRLWNGVPATVMVEADRDQLFRVLHNMARNAVEAGAKDVWIRSREGEGETVIDIADDGPGLAPKARENLFRPFAGSTRQDGTGLGLAIAREVMRAHGGDIQLRESTGLGTAFALILPQPGGTTALGRMAAPPPEPAATPHPAEP